MSETDEYNELWADEFEHCCEDEEDQKKYEAYFALGVDELKL